MIHMTTPPPMGTTHPKPIASIVVGRGEEWKTKPVVMLEDEAIVIAAECRKRGLTAKVERL